MSVKPPRLHSKKVSFAERLRSVTGGILRYSAHVAARYAEIEARKLQLEEKPQRTPDEQEALRADEAWVRRHQEFELRWLERQNSSAAAVAPAAAAKRLHPSMIDYYVQPQAKRLRGSKFVAYLAEVCMTPVAEDRMEAWLKQQRQEAERSACQSCSGQLVRSGPNMYCTRCGREVEAEWQNALEDSATYERCAVGRRSHYDRKNHLAGWLQQIQGAESKRVEDEVVDAVWEILRKMSIPREKVTAFHIRPVLKQLGLPKMYAHRVQIAQRINPSYAVPQLTPEQEAAIHADFKKIEAVYPDYKFSGKSNMVNYGYLLRKLLSMRGMHEMAALLPKLESRDKETEYDLFWRQICMRLDWPYEATALE